MKRRNFKSLEIAVSVFLLGVSMFAVNSFAQQPTSDSEPVVVQPGAPGQATKVLPSSTRAKLPPISSKDIEFMQGMIMHHGQAVDMTALIEARTENKDIRRLGARISQTQAEEIEFMKRWLTSRGEKTTMKMGGMGDMKMDGMGEMNMADHKHHKEMLMPGMLTAEQMEALAKANGAEFDRLFLSGMIQHHEGALVMVDDLFKSPGAGQEAELFGFATDIDSTQRSEIRIMQSLLEGIS
ncbi:MAG: DUF305 domain-containing protein [Pyrinomonadaceae bacterium]